MPEKGALTVLGLGNLLLSDEGAGVHVIRALENDKPSGVVLLDGGTGGQDLLFWIEGAAGLIVVDSIDCGAEPGTLFRFRPQDLDLESAATPYSLHEMRLPDILRMAERAGSLPPTVVLAVQVGMTDWGLELSPAVAGALPRLVDAVKREIAFWMVHRRFAPTPRADEG